MGKNYFQAKNVSVLLNSDIQQDSSKTLSFYGAEMSSRTDLI